jgi:hypothetical protein
VKCVETIEEASEVDEEIVQESVSGVRLHCREKKSCGLLVEPRMRNLPNSGKACANPELKLELN